MIDKETIDAAVHIAGLRDKENRPDAYERSVWSEPETLMTKEQTAKHYQDLTGEPPPWEAKPEPTKPEPTKPEPTKGKQIMTQHENTIAAIDRTILKKALDAVMTSASSDETRPNLAGVLLETDPKAGLLRFVSTDGHRLTKLETAANPEFEVKAGSVLLPYRDVKALIGVLRSKGPAASYPEPFTIRVNDGRVGFHGVIDGSVTEIKAADAKFPPYEKVIPDYEAKPARETCNAIGWNAQYMADVAKVAKFAGNTTSGGVKVSLGGDHDPVRIDMSNGEASAVVVIMPMRI